MPVLEWSGYKIKRVPLKKAGCYGDCTWENGVIRIERSLTGREELKTFIHEALHALDPDMSENKVLMIEEQIGGQLLYDLLGYRKP